MLNHIIIMGRLTRDPELRQTNSGRPVASFSLAVDRDFRDKGTGERVTDFIDVTAWQHTAEFVSRYFTKGRMAVVEGRLQMEDWTDKDGNKRRTARVVANSVYFGDSRPDGQGTGNNTNYATGFVAPATTSYGQPDNNSNQAPVQAQPSQPTHSEQFKALVDEDDESLPF